MGWAPMVSVQPLIICTATTKDHFSSLFSFFLVGVGVGGFENENENERRRILRLRLRLRLVAI